MKKTFKSKKHLISKGVPFAGLLYDYHGLVSLRNNYWSQVQFLAITTSRSEEDEELGYHPQTLIVLFNN
jgi:hypothetical protein